MVFEMLRGGHWSVEQCITEVTEVPICLQKELKNSIGQIRGTGIYFYYFSLLRNALNEL